MSFTPEQKRVAAEVADKLKGKHRQWLEKFGEEHDTPYDQLMEKARQYVAGDIDYHHIGVDIDYGAFPEFWDHYEAMTAEEVPKDKRDNFFSCSC